MEKTLNIAPSMGAKKLKETVEKLISLPNAKLTIVGEPGFGKTEIAEQVANELLAKNEIDAIVNVSVGSADDASFIAGFVVYDKDSQVIRHVLPEKFSFKTGQKIVIIADEINRAPIDVQNACLTLFNRNPVVGVQSFSDIDLRIIATANPAGTDSGASEFLKPQKSRGYWLNFIPNLKDIAEYLQKKYPESHVAKWLTTDYCSLPIDFDGVNNDDSQVEVNGRSIENAIYVEKLGIDFVAMSIGLSYAAEYTAFLKSLETISPSNFLNAKKEKSFSEIVKKFDREKSHLLVTAGQSAMAELADNEKDTKKQTDEKLKKADVFFQSCQDLFNAGYVEAVATLLSDKKCTALNKLGAQKYFDFIVQLYGKE